MIKNRTRAEKKSASAAGSLEGTPPTVLRESTYSVNPEK